jgi:hypothetical protein
VRNLRGQKFGRLTPTRIVGRKPVIWECLCDCGKTCKVRATQFVPSKRGHTQSCGCLRAEVCGNRVRKRPFEWLYNIVKSRKKWVDLGYEEFLAFTQTKECHYCGAPLNWQEWDRKKRGGTQCYNLDCKNNALGYTKANLVACCTRCNAGKSDKFTYEEWVEIGKVIRALRENRLATAASR